MVVDAYQIARTRTSDPGNQKLNSNLLLKMKVLAVLLAGLGLASAFISRSGENLGG